MVSDRPGWGIYGNGAAVDRMKRAVIQGPRHAYLLAGPEGIGKSRLATAFAAALLCPNAPAPGESCGECSSCRRISRGVHPDVSRFDLAYQQAREDSASKNLTLNIATVRDVGRFVALRPIEAMWRVVVIDDVETMQEPAQEAFLKTLEEPPGYVVILLLCADAELLLPTLLSRCTMVPMVPPVDGTVRQALVAAGASEEDAARVAVAARGRVGLALRGLEDPALLSTLAGHVSAAREWLAGDEYSRLAEAYRLAERYSADRDAVFDRLLAAQVAWRSLTLAAAGVEPANGHAAGGSRLGSVTDGVRALQAIERCILDLEGNVRPRAALGTMVGEWPVVQGG